MEKHKTTPSYEMFINGEAGGYKLPIALAQAEVSEGTTVIALTTEYAVMEIRGMVPGTTFITLHTRDPKADYIRIDDKFIAALGLTQEQFHCSYPHLNGVEWLDTKIIPAVVKASQTLKTVSRPK